MKPSENKCTKEKHIEEEQGPTGTRHPDLSPVKKNLHRAQADLSATCDKVQNSH